MKKAFLFFLILGMLLGVAYAKRVEFLRLLLEPFLEKSLTKLFDMKVEIEGLRVEPFKQYVSMDLIRFNNQPEFNQEIPHFEIKQFEFDLDFRALRQKEVLIKRAILGEFIYFIDRIPTSTGGRNNVITWWHHMKANRKKKSSPEELPGKKWLVRVERYDLHNGTFIFHERSKPYDAKYVFRELEGYLTNFEFPTKDPAYLPESVRLEGKIGELYPVPFVIEGRSNFATKKISFNLKGRVPEGNVLDYPQMWSGSPVEATSGTYELDAHVICVKRNMKSRNLLNLKNLKVVSGEKVTDKIWGVPTKAWIGFVQNQKTMKLVVPWNGEISSPEFDFDYALRNAFHESLRLKTKASFSFFTEGPAKITKLAKKASTRAAEGIGRGISGVVKPVTNRVEPVLEEVV